MLNQFEEELFKSVARNPSAVPSMLISPEVNMAGTWFTTPLAARLFSAVAQDALMDKPASLVSVLLQSSLSKEENDYVISLWKSGKITGDEDPSITVNALKNDSMTREVTRAWQEYNAKLRERPSDVREHINDMGAELSIISHDGVGYNPDPTAHYDDAGTEIIGSWGSHSIDDIYGGIPNSGYGLFIAPSGYGKSSFSRSLIVHSVVRSVLGEEYSTLIALNEMDAGVTSRGIRDALRDVWQSERTHEDIDTDIKRHVKVYEDVYNFSRFEQMVYWHRPNIAIIDSLDALNFPAGAERYKDPNDKHQARAIALHDISNKYGCFILVPANASGENQIMLKNGNLGKVQNASAFGSAWYQSKSTFSTVMTWDTVNPNTSLFKNTKDRLRGQAGVGKIISMTHSNSGRYYRDPVYVTLNP